MRFFICLFSAVMSIALLIGAETRTDAAAAHARQASAQGPFVLAANSGANARGACIKRCKSSYNCTSKSPGDKPACTTELRNCVAACK